MPLPGHSFITGSGLPQDFVRTPTSILIAAGREGGAIADLDASGNIIHIRSIDLVGQLPLGEQSMDTAVGGPRPMLIGYDPNADNVGRSTAYSVTAAGKVVKSKRLPGNQTAVASGALVWSDTEDLLIGNDGVLRWVDTGTLAVTHQARIPFVADGLRPIARLGNQILLSVSSPTRLVELNSATLKATILLQAASIAGGPVAVASGRIYWAPAAGRKLYEIDPVSHAVSTRAICIGARSITVVGTSVFVACTPAKVVVLDGATTHQYSAGGFPARMDG